MDSFQPAREEQLTEQKLNWGYWWVTHKLQVRKATIIVLSIVDFLLIGNFVFAYADWFWGSGVVERANIAQLTVQSTDYAFFRSKNAPRDVQLGSASVIASGEDKFDIVAQISNENRLWWADFDYHFQTPGGPTPTQRGYVLPNESRPLAALGVNATGDVSSALLVLENFAWHRVNQHFTRPDYPTWQAQRLNLQLGDASIIAPSASDAVPATRVRFRVTNDSGFGYYKVGFFITLIGNGGVVGVNKVTISELRAGQIRDVEATWFSDLPSVSDIEVKPDLNIFDERNYIAPGR